jgi:hypothetical protein
MVSSRARVATAGCFFGFLLVLVMAPSAGAYSVSRYGYTGYTEVPATYGHRSVSYGAQMFMPSRRICTTNAYQARQRIQVTFRNWKWLNGEWQPYGYTPNLLRWAPTYTETWRLPRNSCTDFPGNGSPGVQFLVADWDPYLVGGSGGYFSSDIVIRWYKSWNGGYLGKKIVDYNGYDFLCDSPQGNFCETGNGWVYLVGFSG